MIRLVSTASILAVTLTGAIAFAKPATIIEHFRIGKHLKVTERVTFHPKTGVKDIHTTIVKADGEVKTVSKRETPLATGGFTVTRAVTGFNGDKTTSTHTSAPGGDHGSGDHGSGDHGGADRGGGDHGGHGGGGHGKA